MITPRLRSNSSAGFILVIFGYDEIKAYIYDVRHA